MLLEGFVGPKTEDEQKYIANGWWRNITFGDYLDEVTDRFSDRTALIDGDVRLTYRELGETINRITGRLRQLGIRKGDCVLLQLPNKAEFLYSFFALQKIGAPAILLLPRHSFREIDHFCRLTHPKAWILPEAYHKTDYLPVIDQIKQTNNCVEHVITLDGQDKRHISWSVLTRGETISDIEEKPAPSDIAFVMPTGGTTGKPKAVPRTHNSAICDALYRTIAREQTEQDTCLLCVPLEHNLGLAAMNGTLFTGGKLVFLDSTRPEDFCAMVEKENITCAPLVPTLLSRLVSFPDLKDYDLSSLRALYVGGAKTPADVIQALHDRIGRVYTTAFGMSEGTGCTTRLDDAEHIVSGSVGRPCCPYDDYLVVDSEGNRLPNNTEGELVVKGPSIFFGYLQNPEENARAFTTDGYFRTGDLAIIDESGYFWITGRSKDLIIRGGENISPADIEAMIRDHPNVDDVSVIGVPDKEFGEKACAYVRTKQGTQLCLEDIVSFLKHNGASVLQLPEMLELIDEIPLTNIGKPDKKALREDFAGRQAARDQ